MQTPSMDHLPEGEMIRQRVMSELSRNTMLMDEDIVVSAEGDEVILDGVVDSMDKKWLAEDVANDTFGVLHVVNQIQVQQRH